MSIARFENREDAGARLAQELLKSPLKDPVVLAIPRGGLEVAAPIARMLPAELDIVLSRKLRAPHQPELALGAVSETGVVSINHHGRGMMHGGDVVIEQERLHQLAEIERRKQLFRSIRPQAAVKGRSVILTDDGIATGSTMIAAIMTVRAQEPHELIVAVPVAPEDRLGDVRALCDRVVCLFVPQDFWAVGQFYRNFGEVTDARAAEILREFTPGRPAQPRAAP